jgi:hypothetical protein
MEPLTRRGFLGRSLVGASWLTALGHTLSRAAAPPARQHSLIVLWLAGGPSQLETFDPHPGTDIAAGTEAIDTAVRGVKLARGLERTAEQMKSIALVRSMVSKEGDHERGTYTMKTGHRPDPTIVHASIGAVLCHELPAAGADIPRHISILPNQWSARGGHLGDQYDAFRTGDPLNPVPDTRSAVDARRDEERLRGLSVVEKAFAKGRTRLAESTGHHDTIRRARAMMSSEQLAAFDVTKEPLALRRKYGDTPFGRACLAARRLTEAGARCVEVTLDGWDTHVNNHALVRGLVEVLDPAFAALVADLRERGRLDRTMVLVAGEFGRTPRLNPLAGRDHWPNGFSVALAGGGVKGGVIVGATDPEGKAKPADPVTVDDLHATILSAAGVEYDKQGQTKLGRTWQYSKGAPVEALLG